MATENEKTNETEITKEDAKKNGKVKEKKEKMVKVLLPLTRTEKEDVYVAVNGRPFLIKRGVHVEVPASVAEVLEHSDQMLNEALEFEAKAAANAQ